MKESLLFYRRAALVWLVVIGAEFLHGTARGLLLEPLVGDFRARQIAVFSGIVIIFAIACLFARRFAAARDGQLLSAGALWVILTVLFELSLGRLLGLSWARIFEDYDLANGGLMPIGLAFLLFAPLLAVKSRAGALAS
jgi:hypothetical protein